MASSTMIKAQQNLIIKKTVNFVRKRLGQDSTGHDWWHIQQVYRNALTIAATEKGDLFVIGLAALLHDIADHKFHNGDITIGPRIAAEWLDKNKVAPNIIEHVCDIIGDLSFKGAGVKTPMHTIEGKIVQDADRLEALGAVGIARVFAYGGHKGQPIYDAAVKPKLHKSFAQYSKSKTTSINHFYEKLLLLKKLMNTKTGKKIAAKRHKLMLDYLKAFYAECGHKPPRPLR